MIRIAHPTPSPGKHTEFDIEFVDGTAIVDDLDPDHKLALIEKGCAIVAEA